MTFTTLRAKIQARRNRKAAVQAAAQAQEHHQTRDEALKPAENPLAPTEPLHPETQNACQQEPAEGAAITEQSTSFSESEKATSDEKSAEIASEHSEKLAGDSETEEHESPAGSFQESPVTPSEKSLPATSEKSLVAPCEETLTGACEETFAGHSEETLDGPSEKALEGSTADQTIEEFADTSAQLNKQLPEDEVREAAAVTAAERCQMCNAVWVPNVVRAYI